MDAQTEPSPESFRTPRLCEHGRQIQREAQALATAVEEGAAEVAGFLNEQTQRHPYRTLAAAASVGYVIGGGLASRLTKLMLGVGGRLTIALAARELSRLLQSADTRAAAKATPSK